MLAVSLSLCILSIYLKKLPFSVISQSLTLYSLKNTLKILSKQQLATALTVFITCSFNISAFILYLYTKYIHHLYNVYF